MEKERVLLKKVRLPNGETIAYRERRGGEEKILLIHGNMTSSKHWDLLFENMDVHYKIFAVDMRGFGGSSYRNRIHSIKDFSDDIKLFADEITLKDFSIIGWSTGGAVGMQFAADYPDYCKRLVLLASASTRGYPFYKTGLNGLPDIQKRLKTYEEIKQDLKTITIQGAYERKDSRLLKNTWDMLIYTKNKPEPDRYEEYIDDMLTQRNLAEVYHALNTFNISDKNNGLTEGSNQVQKINIPVLVLHGDRDLVVTENMTEEILEDFQGRAEFVQLKDCGHSPLVDDLEQLLKVIDDFFTRK